MFEHAKMIPVENVSGIGEGVCRRVLEGVNSSII
jgi:hypothetical protein